MKGIDDETFDGDSAIQCEPDVDGVDDACCTLIHAYYHFLTFTPRRFRYVVSFAPSTGTCPDPGAKCEATEGTTIKTIEVLSGFYRHGLWSPEVLTCPEGSKENPCLQTSAQNGSVYCTEGYTGPLCSNCAEFGADAPYYRDSLSKACK